MAEISKETGTPPEKEDARAKLAADARPEKFKIGDKEVTLQGGFNRHEKPEERKVFPAPDYAPNLVPKDSPNATTGEAPRSVFDTVKKDISGTIGDVLGKGVAIGSKISHRFAGDDWTNYGQDRSLLGRAKDLSRPVDLRNQIEKYNLKSSYPPGENTAGVPQNLVCPSSSEVERSSNGTCNDLKDPAQGAAGTRFQYNTKPDMRYGIDDPPLMETAKILARTDGFKELPVLNLLGAFNLQANVHDWMDHGKHQNMSRESFYHIPLPSDHPIAQLHGQKEMLVPKLLEDGTRTVADTKANIRTTYEDTVTHWWDASEIYGSDAKTADRLRTHKDGQMILDKDGLLPMGPEGVPDTGFNQNWNPGLEVVHTLYVREHNSICDMLTKNYPQDQYPQWKEKLAEIIKPMFGDPPPDKLTDAQYDQFVYSRARLINAAEMAKIHTVDWTPVALNNKTMTDGLITNYGQERTEPFSKIFNEDELGGIWGNKIHKAGVPYEMEEDFVQSYQQMHALVPDDLKLFDYKTDKPIADIPMDHALQGDAHTVIKNAGFDNVLYSLQKDKAGQIAAHNDPNFMRDLNIRGNHIDLTAIDILRGREKHLPRYNEYLREMHMPPVKSFEELIPDNPKMREEVRKVYNNDIEKVDTVIGSLAEWPGRSAQTMGFSGSTFLEFILMASRRVQSDRFYTTDFRPEVYTPEGIDRVRGLGGMKDIINRNAPNLKNIEEQRQSAFHPLGTGPIPLNNSGIDELPTNDIQAHLAAFDTNHTGELSVGKLATGFEDIGYSAPVAYFKAASTEAQFGSLAGAVGADKIQIAKIKPDKDGMYNADGNLDPARMDALFDGKTSIRQSDIDAYLKTRNLGFFARQFVEGQFGSAFKTVEKDSITRDEFVKIMNGDLIKQKIAAAEKAKADAKL